MIKLDNIEDMTNRKYLKQNPDFANQLLATLNQVDHFSPNNLGLNADSRYGTYDYYFSPNYKIEKDAFVIANDQMQIRSTNRDDLLNPHYYQHLNDLASNNPIKSGGAYFPQDQVLQFDNLYINVPYLNIKLTKAINQYDQKQLNAIKKFTTNVYHNIVKDDKLDGKQFDEQGKQEFNQNGDVGIVFDLKDFANPKILMRGEDENYNNHYENDYLKRILKPDAPLLKFLNQSNFATHFQPYQSRVNKFFKRFLDL